MSAGEGAEQAGSDNTAIRPFQVGFPEAELTELRRRVNAARWPERETVADDSQGVRLAMMQELARYWGTGYDWRTCEARLNDLPQFMTEIDGLDIHFIHVRSRHQDALPLIVTHGWPGSIIEQLKIIEPLTNPAAHGATAADAFVLSGANLPIVYLSGDDASIRTSAEIAQRIPDVDVAVLHAGAARVPGKFRDCPVSMESIRTPAPPSWVAPWLSRPTTTDGPTSPKDAMTRPDRTHPRPATPVTEPPFFVTPHGHRH